jgi:predicted RNA-binding protein YlqC (UPF0109 family)
MKELVLTIVRALAEHPDGIRVAAIDGRQTAVVEVRCDARDLGRLIGKSGRTINAIQVLLGSLAARQRRRVILDIVA